MSLCPVSNLLCHPKITLLPDRHKLYCKGNLSLHTGIVDKQDFTYQATC